MKIKALRSSALLAQAVMVFAFGLRAEENPVMTAVASETISGYVDSTHQFTYRSRFQTNPIAYYATIPERFRPGLGNPVLVLQRDQARPIAAHATMLPWGRRTIVTSAIAGEIRYTFNGSQPTATSRRYLHPIMHSSHSAIRVGVFREGQIVAEALVFPKIEMLERTSWARAPRGRIGASGESEILTEVSREVLRQTGGILTMPPLPPTSLTTPEDRQRITAPPLPTAGN